MLKLNYDLSEFLKNSTGITELTAKKLIESTNLIGGACAKQSKFVEFLVWTKQQLKRFLHSDWCPLAGHLCPVFHSVSSIFPPRVPAQSHPVLGSGQKGGGIRRIELALLAAAR